MFLRIIFFLLLVFGFTYCVAGGGEDYSPQWAASLALKSLKDIPYLLAKEVSSDNQVSYINDKDQKVVAKTCNDYLRLTKHGFSPLNNCEIARESFFRSICEPLEELQHIQSAKYSYLRNFDLKKDYGLLPAALVFPNVGNGPQPHGDVKTCYSDTKVENSVSSDKASITLTSQLAHMQTHMAVLAWGDFNQDGMDDMLVFVANYIPSGTYHFYSTYVLTRKSAHAPLSVIS